MFTFSNYNVKFGSHFVLLTEYVTYDVLYFLTLMCLVQTQTGPVTFVSIRSISNVYIYCFTLQITEKNMTFCLNFEYKAKVQIILMQQKFKKMLL